MHHEKTLSPTASGPMSVRRFAPVLVLLLLAPVVAEVLFGATPVCRPGGLLLDIAVYGCGALLIRELARRRGLGWLGIAVLVVAYGVVEEGLALGSLFNPELFGAGDLGGRALGINWVWTEWTLGYHAVWSISIPILLAELLFPARRAEPWLGRAGLAVTGVVYALGVLAFAAIFRFVVAPEFVPPAVPFAGAALLVVGLVVLALRWPASTAASARPEPGGSAPSPWLVGLFAFLVADAWFVFLGLPDALRIGAWVLIPMLVGVALVALVVVLIRRWSVPDRRWTDVHRLALVLGALLTSMLYGFFFVTAVSPIDRAGQAIVSAVALALLAVFVWSVRKRVTFVKAYVISEVQVLDESAADHYRRLAAASTPTTADDTSCEGQRPK